MGYKLYREIRDNAPADWTAAERLVAWVIADDASDKTRRSWLKLPDLCQRAGLTADGVRKALQRLAARGYEFRIPVCTGRDGRPVFAVRGHSLDYLVPVLPARPKAVPGGCLSSKGGTSGLPSGEKGGTPVPPLSSVRPSLLTNDGPREDLASRRARTASRASANRDIPAIIRDVKAAVTQVDGEREAVILSDDEALGLYFSYVTPEARPKVHDLVAYMVRIIGDCNGIDGALSNSEDVCPSCVRYESDCQCAA